MTNNATWYYTDAAGQQAGPVSELELKTLLSSGTLNAQTMVWSEGMDNWVLASSISTLNQAPAPTTATPAAASLTPQASNPYAPPQTHVTATVTDDDYPLPYVKRTNYALFALLLVLGFIVFIVGIVMMAVEDTGSAYQPNPYGFSDSPTSGEDVSPATVLTIIGGLGLLVWGGILSLIYTYRAWMIVQPGGASTTPGKAVGFLFIPLFSIYWMFVAYWKWAQDWNRICNTYRMLNASPRPAEGLFLACAICTAVGNFIGLVGLASIVLYLIIMKQMCDVVNYAHDLNAKSAPQNSGSHRLQ